MQKYIRNITTTSALQIYRFIRYGSFFLTAILLAQLGVSQTGIGAYEWMLHILYTLSFFWINGFSQSFLIQTGKSNEERQQYMIKNLWGLSLLIALAICFILVLAGNSGSLILLGVENIKYWDLYLMLIAVGLPPLIFEYFLIGKEEHAHLLIWGIVSNTGHLICTILPFVMGFGLTGMLIAHIILNIARLLYMFISLGVPYLSIAGLKEWRGGLQLSVYTIIGGLPVAFDTWLVGFHFQTEEQIAIFRYGARELPLIMILLGSVHLGILSTLSSNMTDLKQLKRKVLQTMHWLGPLAIILMFCSPFLYVFLFRETFVESASIFNIYLLILLSRWILSHTIAMAYEEYKVMNIIAMIELMINVGLSFLWIKTYGLEGVIYATIIAFLFEKIALMIFLYLKHKVSPVQYLPVRAYSAYSFLLILSFIISRIWLF